MRNSDSLDRNILVMTSILLIGFVTLGLSAIAISLPQGIIASLKEWQTLFGAIIALSAALYATQFVKKQIDISNIQYDRMLDQAAVSNRQALIDMVEQVTANRKNLDEIHSEISSWSHKFDLNFTSFKINPTGHGIQSDVLHEMKFEQFSRLINAERQLRILKEAVDTPPVVKDGVSDALEKIKPELAEFMKASSEYASLLNIAYQIKKFEFISKNGKIPETNFNILEGDNKSQFYAYLALSQRTTRPQDFFPTYVRLMMASNSIAAEINTVNELYYEVIESLKRRVRKLDFAIIRSAEMIADHVQKQNQ